MEMESFDNFDTDIKHAAETFFGSMNFTGLTNRYATLEICISETAKNKIIWYYYIKHKVVLFGTFSTLIFSISICTIAMFGPSYFLEQQK